ncbi:MAG TPA: 50S ribosomal protein L21 [Chloroflexota bacterium]|nr:50S ribosomal protein L21 [Chloroflexota bacterium]
MPYAIVRTGGRQFRVEPGQSVDIELLEAAPGDQVEFREVLMVGGEGGVTYGRPLVEGAKVVAQVVEERKGPKLIIFKYKPKTRYRRKTGHRQRFTRVSITEIVA